MSEELLKQKAMFEETSRLLEATTRELEAHMEQRLQDEKEELHERTESMRFNPFVQHTNCLREQDTPHGKHSTSQDIPNNSDANVNRSGLASWRALHVGRRRKSISPSHAFVLCRPLRRWFQPCSDAILRSRASSSTEKIHSDFCVTHLPSAPSRRENQILTLSFLFLYVPLIVLRRCAIMITVWVA
jgi:hypothetical protein